MSFECLISEGEFVRANKLFSRPSRKHWYFYALAIAAFVSTAALTQSEVIRYGAIFGLIGGVMGHLVVRHVLAPFITRRQYRKYNAIHESHDISLEEDGIRYIGSDSNSLVKWAHLMKWREDDELILIYQNPRLYHLIPKRLGSVGLDIEGIRRKLAETIGNAT